MSEVTNIVRYGSKAENLEALRKEYEEGLKLGESLERLMRNRDFKKVIQDGFLKDNAARSVKISTNIRMSLEQREAALATAQAAGYFEQYIESILQLHAKAKNEIKAIDEELLAIRNEDEEDSEDY